jgi:hypothetical protein
MDASSAITDSEPCKAAAFGDLSSDVSRQRRTPVIYYSDGVFQGPILRIDNIRAISSLDRSAGRHEFTEPGFRTRRNA